MATDASIADGSTVSIKPLLKELEPLLKTHSQHVQGSRVDEIALAMSQIFARKLSDVQTTVLLTYLYFTGLEQQPEVLAKCAGSMRDAAEPVDIDVLHKMMKSREIRIGNYFGGLCDVVGTGGDHHSTFNISTAASILCSSLLRVAKHGNRASTSRSGSSDVLAALRLPEQPRLEVVGPDALDAIYRETNYAFLFAPNFHKGLRHVSGLRKELSHPTIFNLLGPLANPVEAVIEARVIGVKKKDLVPVYADALRLTGVKKAMVVCGDEDLDEISCAGITHCARLVERANGPDSAVEIDRFVLEPQDFGLPNHALTSVSPGQDPDANAKLLTRLVANELPDTDPVLHFVLMNTAALFVISGVCDADTDPLGEDIPVNRSVGPGKGRWRHGVDLARRAIKTGRAREMLTRFTKVTNELAGK